MDEMTEAEVYIIASGLSAEDAAAIAQQRADELNAVIRELEFSIDLLWHGDTLTTLREHADHWQALAHGAASAGHARAERREGR
jgi:hypothetical protein